MKIEHLILKYQEKGITFSVEDNKLKYSSPKGAINKEAIDEIKKQKMELIEYIKNNPSKIVVDIDNKYKEFPLTDIQSAYLVGRNSVYEYGGIGCKIYSEFEFPKIDILRLEAAWEKVIENNDMLHAVIHNNGTQSILENYKIPRITNWNLESLDENEIDKHFKNIRERLIKKQYHPEKWPLFDLELSEFKEKSIIHFSLDMLIADFTSINLIVKELEECYFNINMKNKEYRKMLSFRDVMIYDRNRKNNPEYINKRKHDKQYWTDRVKKLPCSPILPIDSMKEKNVSITQFNTIINKDNYKKLKQLAKDERVTVSNILLSLYIEILSYWSQQKSFCINVTISNRPPIHSEINNIIGDFTVNDILEVKDINDCNFIERVKAVQKQLFDDISHLSFTGIEVIREMKKIYGKSFTMPFVYTSTLGLDNSDDRKNYKSKLVYKISQTPQVLIDCQVMEHNEEILITWDVRNNIFPDKIIEHMFSMYENILAKIVKGNVFNEKNIVGLPLEMKTKRDEINNNKKYFKEEALHEGFLNNVKIHPDLEALNIENKSYSYEDLYLYANAVRNVLIEKGAKYGDIIIVELDKGIWQIASVIGILMIGGVYLPIDNEQPVERKNQIKIDSKSKFVITYGADNINKANNLIEINVNEICTFEHSGIISEKVDPSNPAYIIYTSGSTGVPKGVVISHRAAMNTINDIIDRFNITKDDKVLAVANLAFDLSVFDIFAILKVGGSIILPDGKKNPSEWAKLVIDNSVTIWNSVPAQIQMLLSYLESENIKNIQSLRLILLSGDWIPVKLPERLNKIFDKALIVSLGGATEASIWSIYYNIDLKRKYFKSIPYGRPLSNQSFYVLDSNLKECPDWVKGELYIGGDGLAIEYLNEKKITDSKFIYHKILNKRLYRTGDLGRYMPDGNIEFLGREDNQLKIRGHRIELNEIQSVIESHPYVENSIIISFSENKDKIAAFVQPIMEESGVLQKKLIDLKKVISEKSNGVSLHISNDKLNKWLEISNKTPLLDIINLFLKLDIFTDAKRGYSLNEICEKVDVIESYRPLLKRWVNALKEEKYIIEENKKYKINYKMSKNEVEESWKIWNEIAKKINYSDIMMNYFMKSKENLLPLLRGEIDPIDLFFPKGDFSIALAAYRDNIISKYLNRILIINIITIVELLTKKNPQHHIKILEVGAGVGGVSIDLIPALDKYNISYLFTDISYSFLNEAQRRFKNYSWVDYALYDINEDFWKQNMESSKWDIIICNNVLHNANDEIRILKQFNEMSKINGYVFIIDATGKNYALLTSMEFHNGLNGVEDFRGGSDQVFLSKKQWKDTFKKSGIEIVSAFPESDSYLNRVGQTLFVGIFKSNKIKIDKKEIDEFSRNRLPEYMIPSYIEIINEIPITPNGKIDRRYLLKRVEENSNNKMNKYGELPANDLEKRIAGIWCKKLKKDVIYRDDNFYNIGGDSLLAAQIVAEIKEKIVEAKEWTWDQLMSAIIENSTIKSLAGKLQKCSINITLEKKHNLAILEEKAEHNLLRILIHDGTGTITPYNELIPYLKEDNNSLGGFICSDMNEYLSIDYSSLIRTLGNKYANEIKKTDFKEIELIGYCMGGLIALEIYKNLAGTDLKIRPVISIDTTPNDHMVYNELLMERAFGLLIGADIIKAGHTVDDRLIKLAVQNLKMDYKSIVSNKKLISLSGEYEAIGDCYKKMLNKSKKDRLIKIYETLPQVNKELWGYQKERLDLLFEVFCHSFRAVKEYNETVFAGDVWSLSCKDKSSSFLPIKENDNNKFWENITYGNLKKTLIDGNHLSCLSKKYSKELSSLIMNGEENAE